MKITMLLASAAMMGVVFLAAPVNAQGVQQTVAIAKLDVQTVAAGYRASKVVGSSVLHEASETIGKIDDLLVTRDGSQLILLAIFAVGTEPMQKAGAIAQTPGKRPNPSRAQGDMAG
jgi:hypothetical protein